MTAITVFFSLSLVASLLGCGDKDGDGTTTGDGGATDGGATDGGATDAGTTDGGTTDGGSTDGGTTDGGTGDGGTSTEDANSAFGPWVEAPVAVPDDDGVYNLRLAPAEITIDGQRFCGRAYNGQIPGASIVVPSGSDRRLRVDLHNDFSGMDERIVVGDEGWGAEHCYDFNQTNLHFHGSHVRPDYAVGGDACEGEGCGSNPSDGDGLANDFYADNVLIEVPQGSSASYRYDIDEDHVHDPGVHWYHPHIHGSTAAQVSGGAAGALIVEGDFDELEMFENTTERLMVFNHLPWQVEDIATDGVPMVSPLEDGEACTEDTLSFNNFLSFSKASTPLVNGRYRPQAVSAPGQVERWRLLHAGTATEMVMAVFESADETCTDLDFANPFPVIQVAADGIAFPQHWERNWFFMAPGYRAELLVQMPEEPTTLCVMSANISTVITTEGVDFESFSDSTLFSIKVDAEAGDATRTERASTDDIDTQLASVARPTEWTGTVEGVSGVDVSCDNLETGPLAEAQQQVLMVHPVTVLQAEDSKEQSAAGACPGESGHSGDYSDADPCACPLPNLNCRNFGPRRAFETDDGSAYRSDRVMTAGESEHWELSATDAHPYHIHVNPFLVCPSASDKEAPFPHWRDTYYMQFDDVAANGFQPVDILTEYTEDFTGSYVYHCHKLVHEDEGMMELIEVCQPGDDACLCLDGETDGLGNCVTPNGGCYEGDTQCVYAEYMMDTFGPEVLESPVGNDELGAAERNALVDRGLEECCDDVPDGLSDAEISELFQGLTGVDPLCCPEIATPWPPGHPCDT